MSRYGNPFFFFFYVVSQCCFPRKASRLDGQEGEHSSDDKMGRGEVLGCRDGEEYVGFVGFCDYDVESCEAVLRKRMQLNFANLKMKHNAYYELSLIDARHELCRRHTIITPFMSHHEYAGFEENYITCSIVLDIVSRYFANFGF